MQLDATDLPGDITRLALTGRLDFEGSQAIDHEFSYATTIRPRNIIVDLSGVTFLASIGIRLLITSARAQANRGGKLVLVAPQPMVRMVLETAGIDQLIPVVADVEAARASFAG
jgi:anti-sigma B factor antagonist